MSSHLSVLTRVSMTLLYVCSISTSSASDPVAGKTPAPTSVAHRDVVSDPQLVHELPELEADFLHHVIRDAEGELSFWHRSRSGPTLLLIPGTFSDAHTFAELVSRLDTELNLVIAEHRGVGLSWPPMKNPSIEQCADDAIQVRDERKCERFFTAGHSLGGMISLELGRKHSNRVIGVISIEGWTNSDAAMNAFQGDMKSTLSADQLAQLAEERRKVHEKWTPEQIRNFGTIWRKWDGSEFLKTTTLPVLEIYGDRGRPRPDQTLLGIPDRQNIQFVWFSNASHSLHVERPAELAAEFNRFISETPGRKDTLKP